MKKNNTQFNNSESKKIAMKVSKTTIIVNLILFILKLFAGILAKSGAMFSDAIHTASDVFSTFIVIIGVNISHKKPDDSHQYGHERLESVASIVLSVILAITGMFIGLNGIEKIFGKNYSELEIPGILALIAAVLSIAVKEWMYWYTRDAAKKIDSGSLMADAWHHRSDSLSSIGAFIGILGARIGFPILDPVASLVICIFIGKAAFDIFRESVDKLVDKSCDEEILDKIRSIINEQEGVLHIDEIRTRLFGNKMYVDVEIVADGSMSLNEAHEIAERVHDAIEKEFSMVKHCMVHVNPK